MTKPITEKLEILPVELLVEQRPLVEELKRLAASLGLEFGWHYLLDISWIISQLGATAGKHILDAGAGTGVIQWYLADHGAEVISVDRMSRAYLPTRFRTRFRAQGLRNQDLATINQLFRRDIRADVSLGSQVRNLAGLFDLRRSTGRVLIYNQDLRSLDDLKDNSVDAVVAVSALEHNNPQDLKTVIAELLRVIKPGGMLLATLCAARDEDWFHDASQGWCYTADSLQDIFDLAVDTPNNYNRYDELFDELRNCAELRENLAAFYSRSGDNGMPWGLWDPQYQPVGVCKVKY